MNFFDCWEQFEMEARQARSARLVREHKKGKHRALVPIGPLPNGTGYRPWFVAEARQAKESGS
jgi:hypothetical protein